MNLYKGYCTQIIRTCQVSEKKQINKDQIVQDYTRSLVEFYNESKILPVQVIDNLFSKNENLEIGEFWVAHYRKGDFTVKHSHGELYEHLISGCYYAYVEDNASPIIFDGQESIYPKNNSLILFSSLIEHEVPPTDGERIIMSFNICRTQ